MSVMGNIRAVIVAVILLWNGIYDWKYRKISISVTFIGIMTVIFFLIAAPEDCCTIAEILGGVSIGIFLIICSFITRGQIGIGDGIICCFTGISCGFFENLNILFIGLLLSAIVSFILLIGRKVERKTEIPLIPFLFIAYCCVQISKF